MKKFKFDDRIYKNLMIFFIICSFSSFNVEAKYCPKCVKIEEDRANEESQVGYKKNDYYEDYQKKSEDREEVAHLESLQRPSTTQLPHQAPPPKDSEEPSSPPLMENTENADPSLNRSILGEILSIRGLSDVFEKPFTIFLPSDKAIEKFPRLEIQKFFITENRELLLSYISNHIVPYQILRKDFNRPFKTLGGRVVEIEITGQETLLNKDAKILKSFSIGSQGIIYIIDKVLIPIHD